MAEGWRYLAYRLNGNGTETMVHPALPISGASPTKLLSGHHQISGTLTSSTEDLRTETGRPIFERWRTAIYAENPGGDIWCGGVLADFSIDGSQISLDVAGFTAYPADQPYDGPEQAFVGEDALFVYRYMWEWLQAQPGANIGLVIDDTLSGVTVGTPAEDVDFQTSAGTQVSFTAGPYQINAWSTDDVGAKLDELAKQTPFDWIEEHRWEGVQEAPVHFLRIGYPTLGSRKDDLRFILGENVYKIPREDLLGDDVVTGVIVLGAGEGRDRVVGRAYRVPDSSLRRVKTIDDKMITSNTQADARALAELEAYRSVMDNPNVTELVVVDHPNAPLGSYDVGDEIPYGGDHDWGSVEIWGKVTKIALNPDAGNTAIVSIVRSDRVLS